MNGSGRRAYRHQLVGVAVFVAYSRSRIRSVVLSCSRAVTLQAAVRPKRFDASLSYLASRSLPVRPTCGSPSASGWFSGCPAACGPLSGAFGRGGVPGALPSSFGGTALAYRTLGKKDP